MNLPIPTEPRTLDEYLELCEKMDQGLIEMSVEQMALLGDAIEIKVDGYANLFDRCDSEIARFDARIKAFKETRDSLQKNRDRAEALMLRVMQARQIEKLPGSDFVVSVKKNPPKCIVTATQYPGVDEAVEHPRYCRIKGYEWSKSEIKKGLEEGDREAMDLAHMEQGIQLKFTPRKGISDGK